jgi:hypothetical protein
MTINRKLAYQLLLILGFPLSTEAVAQGSLATFQLSFRGTVDCVRPIQASNIPISWNATGVLNTDRSASADLSETAFGIPLPDIHFDGRLGGAATAAPGGTAQLRVAGRSGLTLIWSLPNNQMITTVSVRGRSCSATFAARLKPGKTEYTLFDGSGYHYCDRPRIALVSCEVR